MHILLIKTSSMGDLIHTLPALTDASFARSGIQFDWVVEESFVEIPRWHPSVAQVIPIALRRWRKNLLASQTRQEWHSLRTRLRERKYDYIIDAQGLVKSAFLGFFAKGTRVGLDWRSAREALASLAYQRQCTVNFYQHAVHRMRSLFALALGYPLPTQEADFGIDKHQFIQGEKEEAPYLVFLHGTTWDTKLWPEPYWIELAQLAESAGLRIKISGGNDEEVARAERIAMASKAVDVMPRLSIGKMAVLLARAKGAVAVDTGLGHLAAALSVPTVSLYGATEPAYTGALGKHSIHLAAQFACSPCLNRTCRYQGEAACQPACYATLSPLTAWSALRRILF